MALIAATSMLDGIAIGVFLFLGIAVFVARR